MNFKNENIPTLNDKYYNKGNNSDISLLIL